MPRIPDDYLDVVAFLYPSRKAAEAGRQGGATAFLITYPSDQDVSLSHFYVITCRHCLRPGLTIRMTRRGSGNSEPRGLEFIETKPADWLEHPKKYDVAAYHITDPQFEAKHISALGAAAALPIVSFAAANIGPGNDVYVATRFPGLEHPKFNLPILQTGSVVSRPIAANTVWSAKWVEEPHLLIETHSRIGYSGAPVFAYLSPADQDLTVKFGFQPFLKFDGPLLFPLGVFSRHVNTYGQVRDAPSDNGSPVPGHFAPTPSALGVVIPGWEIFETLSTEDAMTKRKAVEAKWAEEAEGDQPLPTEATPAYAEPAEETLAATEVMMKRLLGVPKDEADEVHRGHTP